jgi:hypothetical protein
VTRAAEEGVGLGRLTASGALTAADSGLPPNGGKTV